MTTSNDDVSSMFDWCAVSLCTSFVCAKRALAVG